MDGKPLNMTEAWLVHDKLFEDDRVTFVPEPVEAETNFREYAVGRIASPKLWADTWLLAFSRAAGGSFGHLRQGAGRARVVVITKRQRLNRHE